MRRHGHGPPAGESAVAARARRLLGAGSLLITAYLGVILVSRVVADPLIPFDQRLLSPVFLLATILVAVCVFHWWHSTASTLPKIALTGALLGWWAATALVTLRQQRRIQRFGADIDAPRWARSELIEFAGTDGASHQLYTNQPAAVYFHLHRPARDVPALGDSDRMEEFADSVRAHDGRVLMFNPSRGPSRRIDVLRRVRGLRAVLDGPSGTAFVAVPRDATPAPPPTAVRPSPPR